MDYGLFEAINGLAGRWTVADEFFRFFANDYIVPTAIVAMLVIDWFRGALRARRVVVHAILALLVANLIVKLSNLLWYRLRPFTLHDVTLLFYYLAMRPRPALLWPDAVRLILPTPPLPAFPSGHAARISTIAMWAGLLAPHEQRHLGSLTGLVLAFTIGWSLRARAQAAST